MDTASELGRSSVVMAMDHVLAPLDGSTQAEAALHWLQHFPVRNLTLLRAHEGDAPGASQAEDYLMEVAQRYRPPDCTVETRVVTGCPAESIVGEAIGADLVVMSTRGAGGGGRLLFGSVADRVARHSPKPTLLLRGGATPVNASSIQRVVIPLDGSPAAERALAPAIELARTLECGAHLVAVEEPPADQRLGEGSPSLSAYLEQTSAHLRDRGLSATIEQRAGEPAQELLGLVMPGDLLVITTHGRGAARRWQMGSVAEKLLRQATAPVVLVRADLP